jgi:short-subunit dehydrogenase
VGRAVAGELAAGGFDLALGARDERDLLAVSRHLEIERGVRVSVRALDLAAGPSGLAAWAEWCCEVLPAVNVVVIAAGAVDDADSATGDPVLVESLTRVNYLGPASLLLALLPRMVARGEGSVVVFSSIAAGAPRRNNAGYAAAKTALESFCKSLRHYYSPNVNVQIYRLGYVDSAMTFGRSLALAPEDPAMVARHVVQKLGGGGGVRYFPRWWRWIVAALRMLPWPIFRRLDF